MYNFFPLLYIFHKFVTELRYCQKCEISLYKLYLTVIIQKLFKVLLNTNNNKSSIKSINGFLWKEHIGQVHFQIDMPRPSALN